MSDVKLTGTAGTPGANGGAGLSGTAGTAGGGITATNNGTIDFKNTAEAYGGAGGRGGNGGNNAGGAGGNAGAGGAGGNATAIASAVYGSANARGGAGGYAGTPGNVGTASSGEGAAGGAGGAASATLTLTTAHGAGTSSGASATGGAGGRGYGTANGGSGGTATATAAATSTTSDGVTISASATGGRGGGAYGIAGSGGIGGAAIGASATATEAAATGGTASARASQTGGAGGRGIGAGQSGGAGGGISGTTATASGHSASASVSQTGGAGGSGGSGANGGAGASSMLTNAVSGTATGGTLGLYQTATGGAGGSSAGGTAGQAGSGTSSLTFNDVTANATHASTLSANSTANGGAGGGSYGTASAATGGTASATLNLTGANYLIGKSTATGGAGGSGYDKGGAAGGAASAMLTLTTAHGVGSNSGASATGGRGGDGFGIANGAAGGTATAAATSTSTTSGTIGSFATATGGTGGGAFGTAGSGGVGGAAIGASATATGGIGTGLPFASQTGGAGGRGIGAGQSGGAGGGVSGTTATASGHSAIVHVYQTGGAGGYGDSGADGGAGASSMLTNAVSGTATIGTVKLYQTATGGAGGSSAGGTAGQAGSGTSSLTFNDVTANAIQATSLTGTSAANGGAGGVGPIGGAGGAATSSINLSGAIAVAATANATGGAGGTGASGGSASATSSATAVALAAAGTATATVTTTGGAGSMQGTATGHAIATTANGQLASANSTATGASGTTDSTATTQNGGAVSNVSAFAQAQVGGTAATSSRADITNTFTFNGSSKNSYAFATEVPSASFISSALASHSNLNSALGGAGATVFGAGWEGAFYSTTASGSRDYKSTITWNLNTTTLSGDLILGLMDNQSLGSGFTSLAFNVVVGGSTVVTQNFTTLSAAQTYFNNDEVDLGAVTGLSNLTVSVNFDLVTNSSGSGFGEDFLIGTTSGDQPPVITVPGPQTVQQGALKSINGISVVDGDAVKKNQTITVVLSDTTGLLTASGFGVSGSGTTRLTLVGTLAQVNSDLSTVHFQDFTAGSDTINLTANDGDGGTNTQAIALSATFDNVHEGPATSAVLSVNGTVAGTIDAEPMTSDTAISLPDDAGGYVDKDWYQVTLNKGYSYTFGGASTSITTGLMDISLYDQNGMPVHSAVEGANPSFTFDTSDQANAAQIYYLAVSAGGPDPAWKTATGDYSVNFGSQPPPVTIQSVVASPSSGDVGPGDTITLTMTFSGPVTVASGTPTLVLNDGGIASYQSSSGASKLVFTYTVGAPGSGENTPDLTLASTNAVNLNGATITGPGGVAADLSGANGYNPDGILQINSDNVSLPGGVALEMLTLAAVVYGPNPVFHTAEPLASDSSLGVQLQYEGAWSVDHAGDGWRPVPTLQLERPSTGTIRFSFENGFYSAIDTSDSFPFNGDYAEANAMVLAGTVNGKRTLSITFRGTDQLADFWDYTTFERYYDKFSPLIATIKSYLSNNGNTVDQVIVSGHSLGASAVQYLTADLEKSFPELSISAYTDGSPGADYPDSVPPNDLPINNFVQVGDPVAQLVPLLSSASRSVKLAVETFLVGLQLGTQAIPGAEGFEEGLLRRSGLLSTGEDFLVGAVFVSQLQAKTRVGVNILIDDGGTSLGPDVITDAKALQSQWFTYHSAELYDANISTIDSFANDPASPFSLSNLGKALSHGTIYTPGPDDPSAIEIAVAKAILPADADHPVPGTLVYVNPDDDYVLGSPVLDGIKYIIYWDAPTVGEKVHKVDGGYNSTVVFEGDRNDYGIVPIHTDIGNALDVYYFQKGIPSGSDLTSGQLIACLYRVFSTQISYSGGYPVSVGTSSIGNIGTGQIFQLTVALSTPVTVDTSGGTPTLTLDDPVTAIYDAAASDPSSGRLVFDYTVGPDDKFQDVQITGVQLNGATIQGVDGAIIDFSAALNVSTGLSLNSPLAATSVSASLNGELGLGQTVQLTLTMNEAVVVSASGGGPALVLNNAGIATYDEISSNPSAGMLVFDYRVQGGEDTENLSIAAVSLPIGTSIRDSGGYNADFSAAIGVATGVGIDTVAPTLTAISDQTLEALGPNGAAATFSATATDLVDGTDPVVFTEGNTVVHSGDTFRIGTHTIIATATDAAGNEVSETFTIKVRDTTPPTLTPLANQTLKATGPNGAVVTFSATATDLVDGTDPVVFTEGNTVVHSGDTFSVGTHTITARATDAADNIDSEQFTIKVQDTTPPTLTPVANQTDEATSPRGAAATFSATATDLVDGTDPVVFTEGNSVVHSGDTFSIGTHTIIASATDTAGNPASETFTIKVQDTTPPTLTPVANQTDEATGSNGAVATFSATATDVVDGTDPVVFKDGNAVVHSGDTFSLGTHTITASATDAAGNLASETFTIKVQDTTVPATPAAPADSAVANGYVNAANDTTAQALTGTAEKGSTVTVYDNGTKVSTTTADASTGAWSYTIGQLTDASMHSYTATATDGAGNVSQASAALSFAVDTAAPTVSSVADTSSGNLSIGGKVTITFTMSEVVTVIGTPTLTLNDGGTATYQSGSGSNKLVFTYIVASTDTNVAKLAVTGSNLNGTNVAVRDGAGNNANLNGADVTLSPAVQIYTTDHWTNASGGSWEKASNWGNGVPNGAVDANVDTNGTYTVAISSADTAYALIVNNAGTTVADNNGGMLTLGGGSGALTISKGTFQLNGGALKAGSISTAPGGTLLIANSHQYTGANSLGEQITDNGAVTIQNSSAASMTGNISGSGALTIQNSSTGNLMGSMSGSEAILVQNSSTATFGSLTGSEVLTVQNSSKAAVSGAVSGSESFVITNSAQLILGSAVNTTGSFSLANSSTLEFGSSDNANVAFGVGSSTLRIDHSLTAPFTGTLSGLTPYDTIDLLDLNWVNGHMTASFSGNASGGTVVVSNGSTSASLKLVGDYTHSTWTLSKDAMGGTNLVDPPAKSIGYGAMFEVSESGASGVTMVTDPTTPTTSWPDSPLGWLEQHIPSVVSDLQGLQHGNGFSQLLNQIENWNSSSGRGSTPTGDSTNGLWVKPNSLGSGFDAGWKSHMAQTMASFGDGKGGPPQASLIQTNDQALQVVLASTTQYHS